MKTKPISALYIDPGYGKQSGGCACAYFERGYLAQAWFERPSDIDLAVFGELDRVVVEEPQQDKRSWGIPPEVLIRLAVDGFAVAGRYRGAYGTPPVVGMKPSAWKGSVPKPIQHARVWKCLLIHERSLLGGRSTIEMIEAAVDKGALERWKRPGGSYYPRTFKTHNLLDAVAMGVLDLKRMVV